MTVFDGTASHVDAGNVARMRVSKRRELDRLPNLWSYAREKWVWSEGQAAIAGIEMRNDCPRFEIHQRGIAGICRRSTIWWRCGYVPPSSPNTLSVEKSLVPIMQ